MKVEHGDILVTSCSDVKMPCAHRAIAFFECGEWWVFQNTPDLSNAWGGNIVQSKLDEFLATRKIRQVLKAKMDMACVRRYNHQHRHCKWDMLRYNCEHYVNEVADGQRISQTKRKYVAAMVCAAVLLIK